MRLPPPGGPHRPVHVLRCPEQGAIVVLFLGPLYGHIEHHLSRKGIPCPGQAKCPHNHAKVRTVFNCYAAVAWLDPRTRRFDPWVLQGSSSLEEQLRGRTLRGEMWSIERVKTEQPSGKLEGTFIERRDPTTLPPEFPVETVLKRLFQVDALNLGVPNPNPDPLKLDTFEIAPLELPEGPTTPALDSDQRRKLLSKMRESIRGTSDPNGRPGK